MSSEAALQVEGLGKRYRITEVGSGRRRGSKDFWALRDVSFDVPAGEAIGLIGRNGAGKSTLLKVLSRITRPSTGRAVLTGRVGALLEVGTGFHPELSGRENVFLNGTLLGMRRREVSARFDEIVEFAQVGAFLDTPVKRYSSGMYVRLAFAVAAHLRTDILLVDEVLAVGDLEFQRRSLGKMDQLAGEGRTVVFVSHGMESVRRLCTSALLIEQGALVEQGPVAQVIDTYTGRRGSMPVLDWHPPDAPGDELVRLRRVSVLQHGQPAAVVDIRHPVELQVRYQVAAGAPTPLTSLVVRNSYGVELFGTSDAHADKPSGESLRTVTSTCRIPGNLLAEGAHVVTVMVHGHGSVHLRLEDALAFQVDDPGGAGTVRGDYAGDWTGVVRPMLEWQVMAAAAPDGAA